MPDFDVLTLSESRKRKSRSHGIRKKGNDKRKRCAAMKLNTSLNDLIRSLIKIPFINKGIGFIDLPSIFQDKSVIKTIPTYFQNSEPPIICYKYNQQSEILFLISINLFLILISMLILPSLEIVKIQNVFINQPDIYILEI